MEKTRLSELERFFSVSLDLSYIADIEGNFIKVNKAWESILGYSSNMLENKSFLGFIHPDDIPDTLKAMQKLKDKEKVINFVNRCLGSNGEYRHIEWQSYPYENMIYASGRDITERLNMQNEIKERELNFKTFFETVDDIIIVGTPEGNILFSNKALFNKLGYSAEELRKMHILELHPIECRNEAERVFAAMFRGERDYCPIPLRKKDGNYLPVETRVWFGKWGNQDCIYGICKDLTLQQAALEKFHKLFDNNPALMALNSVTDRKFIEVNNAFLEKLGYTRSQIIGKTSKELNLFVEAENHQHVFETLKKEGRIKDIEFKVRKNDGQLIDGLFCGEIIDNQIEKSMLTVMTDITESKKMETNLRLKGLLLTTISKAINELMLNPELYAAISKGFELIGKATGVDRIYLFENYYSSETDEGFTNQKIEWTSENTLPQIDNPELQNVPFNQMDEFFEPLCKGRPFLKLVKHIGSKNLKEILSSQRILSILVLPIQASGKFWGFIGFDDCNYERDWSEAEYSILMVFAASISAVIERKLIESKLVTVLADVKSALDEKKVLLKEIHHRVKNNLQIVSSLLYLQAIQANDKAIEKILKDSENRVKAMAMIHEMMYQTEKFSSINFKEYVDNLARYLFETHKEEAQKLNIELDVGNIQLTMDKGIPCGLLLNELISNSLKHAFTNRDNGIIKVYMQENDNNIIHLIVTDNGKGINASDYKKSSTLGLQLVNNLAEQLNAEITIENSNGTKATIVFNKNGTDK